jgi:hypothetical protein
MLPAIRKHVSYANVAATAALVFAMSGGAYAVSGGGASSGSGSGAGASSHAVIAAAKKKKTAPTGKPGPRGPAGPAGLAGTKGETGPAGPAGARGETGTSGGNGGAGESVTIAAAGSECGAVGGTRFSNAGSSGHVCNGEKGAKGTPGTPGEAGAIHPGETLPAKASETGVWTASGQSVRAAQAGTALLIAAISYPIPLATAPTMQVVPFGEGKGEAHQKLPTGCDGNVTEPAAEPGNLCVYVGEQTINIGNEGKAIGVEPVAGEPVPGTEAGKTGAWLEVIAENKTEPKEETKEEPLLALGTWAVTAAS